MPRKSGNGNSTDPALSNLDRAIEQGIDAVNTLRVNLRKAGMEACADALDQAFATCLGEYANRLTAREAPSTDPENDPDTRLN